MAVYCTVTEFRNYSQIPSGEISDAAVSQMVSGCTSQIDSRTGRTWQGIATQTNEYYDGTGTNIMFLDNVDIASVTEVAIDDDFDQTYTVLSSSSPKWYDWYPDGVIKINASGSPPTFTKGAKTVRVTYTYGNATPTDAIKQLCIEMASNLVNFDENRETRIEREIKRLKHFGSTMA